MLAENQPPDSATDGSRDKVKRLFEFLRALEERKNPVPLRVNDHKWHFSLAQLPLHSQIRWFRGGQDDEQQTVYLKVARMKLTKAPLPPEVLREWLTSTWDAWGEALEVLETRKVVGENGEINEILFEDSEDRIAAYREYLQLRNTWIEAEAPARSTNKVYEKLFELWGQLRRDAESLELVLGNAVLSLKSPEVTVQHPLLLAPVQLVFDSLTPEFRIIDAGSAPAGSALPDIFGVGPRSTSVYLSFLVLRPRFEPAAFEHQSATAEYRAPPPHSDWKPDGSDR
jgi:hypothetical protein